MPLLMSSTFAPDGERRLPVDGPGPRAEPQGDRPPQPARRRRLRAVRPRHGDGLPGDQAAHGHGPAGHLQRRPGGAARARHARLALPQDGQAGPAQRRPTADRQRGGLPRRLLRVGHPQGLPRLVSIIGTKVGPRSQGSGLVLLYHSLGEHDGEFGAWPSTRAATAASPRSSRAAATAFGAEILLESPVDAVITKDGRATGVALTDGTEYHADTVVSALDPRRTFLELVNPRELPDDLVESIQRFRFQGTSSKVNFALDGLPKYPALPGPRRPVPRLHQHRAVDGLPRARVRRSQVRLVQLTPVHRLAPSSRRSIPTWRLPASTS